MKLETTSTRITLINTTIARPPTPRCNRIGGICYYHSDLIVTSVISNNSEFVIKLMRRQITYILDCLKIPSSVITEAMQVGIKATIKLPSMFVDILFEQIEKKSRRFSYNEKVVLTVDREPCTCSTSER